jgi:endonuclease/exonuclease/phosphatase family metal-dependent hydrolase
MPARNRLINALQRRFLRATMPTKFAILAILMAVALAGTLFLKPPAPPAAPRSDTVVFMFWNVENLFDDRDDDRNSIDDPYDNWFAQDDAARNLKLDRLVEIILKVNGGVGPDVFAACEVESVRAAELLRDALNANLPASAAKYEHIAMKELSANAGRFIAPCVISRYPLDRTKLLGSNNLRILDTRLTKDGAELRLVVSHWTSQRSDDGTRKGSGRDRYATIIRDDYDRFLQANPRADYLLCGDFNATPDSEVVTDQLRMTGNRDDAVKQFKLFGLLANKPPEKFGTHYYSKPLIYDMIGVSPGMLDTMGWSCDPESVRVPTDGMIRDTARVRRPWRFGGKGDNPQGRGYSDHFPVIVDLRTAP